MINGKKILVVEDYDDSRMLMVLCLRRFGYEVAEAVDGLEALERTADFQPDLIIMDISMPRMDGLEAAARLKADPLARDIPIIIATAHTRESLVTKAIAAGAVDVLIKPIDLLALRKMVGTYIRTQDDISPAASVAAQSVPA